MNKTVVQVIRQLLAVAGSLSASVTAVNGAKADNAPELLEGLLRNNPFASERKSPPPLSETTVDLELLGYVIYRGKISFNLRDNVAGDTTWVTVDRKSGRFKVARFDVATGSLWIDCDGKTYQLAVKFRSSGAASSQ